MRPKPRVLFTKPSWTPESIETVNVRDVLMDGVHVGWLHGINPSPHNEHRPTAYRFVSLTGRSYEHTYDRLAHAREGIERELK
jgi:hypothetical protein